MKIVFFGTSNVALPVLEALHAHYEISAVITSLDAPVGKKKIITESPVSILAKELGLTILKPANFSGPEILEQLKSFEAELFVVVSYGKILPEAVINLPKFKTVNVHFSKLPQYRGPSPIQFMLLNGEAEAYTSIFVLDAGVDTGPVLAQGSMPIQPWDNFITLSQNLARFSADLLIKVLPDYFSGKIVPKEQEASGISHTKIIKREDGKVNWSQTAQQIYNQFRAFYPWPGIWTTWKNVQLKILDCQVLEGESQSILPGTVTSDGGVVCGDGSILMISKLQLAGKKEVGIADFLNGYKDFAQSKLE